MELNSEEWNRHLQAKEDENKKESPTTVHPSSLIFDALVVSGYSQLTNSICYN